MATLLSLLLPYLLKSPTKEYLAEMHSRAVERDIWSKERRTGEAGVLEYTSNVMGSSGQVYMLCYMQGREIASSRDLKTSLQHFHL